MNGLVLVFKVTITEYPYQGLHDLNNRNLFSHSFEDSKSKIKVLAGVVSTEVSLLWLVDSNLLLCLHMAFPLCANVWCLLRHPHFLFSWGQQSDCLRPTLMTQFNPTTFRRPHLQIQPHLEVWISARASTYPPLGRYYSAHNCTKKEEINGKMSSKHEIKWYSLKCLGIYSWTCYTMCRNNSKTKIHANANWKADLALFYLTW